MFSIEAFTLSERCYRALLSLYPAEFKVRFGTEMVQIFRDCCRDQAGKARMADLVLLWLGTIRDLGLSVPRERLQVLLRAEELTARTAGLVDSIVIGAIIGFHLFVGGTGIAFYIGHNYATPAEFLTLATLAGAALGGAGVVCSLILSRFRRIQCRLIELE